MNRSSLSHYITSSQSNSVVYFLQVSTGQVKIGYTREGSLKSRIRELQIGNHQELKLIRAVKGGGRQESWLHYHFRAHRIRGEWFEFCEEMLTIIPSIRHTARPARQQTVRYQNRVISEGQLIKASRLQSAASATQLGI